MAPTCTIVFRIARERWRQSANGCAPLAPVSPMSAGASPQTDAHRWRQSANGCAWYRPGFWSWYPGIAQDSGPRGWGVVGLGRQLQFLAALLPCARMCNSTGCILRCRTSNYIVRRRPRVQPL
jgi:hypothetical protein